MIKLQNSELKIMEVLWEHGVMPARKVAEIIEDNYGWNINTTYTLIKRIIKKDGIKREDPNFMCIPLVKREEVQNTEIKELAEKLFGGSTDMLFTALLTNKGLSKDKIEELKQIIADSGDEGDL